jgi:putative flavoprotein involved in K+ transport
MERVHTVIIGAGQAGLSMSYQLALRGLEHLVIERGRVAERWRSERWDTLMFQFPNWMLRLPDYPYTGADPDGFMHRDGVVRFIEDFAARISPPLHCGIRVTGLQQSPSERLKVETDHYAVEAQNVVVATGPYQMPSVPPFSNELPITVCQIAANRYTHARVLPPGDVLVVGSGGSGCQIAEDLMQSGRRVYLSVGRHRRVPRRYRDKDFGWWQETMGAADQIIKGPSHGTLPPLLTGVAGGRDIDLRELARQGATLVGSLGAVREGRLNFTPDLEQNLAIGDATFAQFVHSVDEYVVSQRLELPQAPETSGGRPHHATASKLPAISILDLKSAGITSVIWAVGYQYDFGWIKCPVFEANGRPVHRRGVTTTPGLYFLGLPRLHKIKSAFLWGVSEDASFLAEHIANRQ